MSKAKCEGCPVAPDDPCLAVIDPEGYGHYCGWARSGSDLQRTIIVNRSKIGPLQMPGLAEQAGNFLVAVANHAASGGRAATIGQTRERLAICQNCEYYQGGRCSKCGCGLSVKASWADQSCPIGKWGTIAENETDPVDAGAVDASEGSPGLTSPPVNPAEPYRRDS